MDLWIYGSMYLWIYVSMDQQQLTAFDMPAKVKFITPRRMLLNFRTI